MMLRKKIHTPQGKRIVQEHRHDWDAQAVLNGIMNFAQNSTAAVLSAQKILQTLTSLVYEPSSGKSVFAHIVAFEDMVESYHDLCEDPDMRLPLPMMKSLLQRSVAGIQMLHDVQQRENERVALGGSLFTFHEYVMVLKTSATLYDEKRTRPSRGGRSINSHTITGEDENGAAGQSMNMSQVAEYVINEMRRRTPGSSMNKETWDSVSKPGKTTWDEMSDEDKVKILAFAKLQAENQDIKVNSHTITDEQTDTSEDKGDDTPAELQVNNAMTDARGQAHAGDMRRMLGGDDSKKSLKARNVNWDVPEEKPLKARNVNWDVPEESYYGMDPETWRQGKEEYWDSDSDSEDSQNFH